MAASIGSRGSLLHLLAAVAVAGALGLGACGGKPPKVDKPPPPAVLRVDVSAAGNANRGPGGQGLPIVVRLYELKGQGAFQGADFFSLYDRESATLAGELIAREELTLAPGRTDTIEKPLDPQTRYLGVVGAFREIDRASWRASVPIVSGKDNRLAVQVGADSIQVGPR
jgi:type VI secretion system protein VasD